jgi:hypothetical protein
VRNENPGAAGSGRGYAVTASWARAQDLYDHLLEYGLAAHIPHNLTFHVGDVIFYRAQGSGWDYYVLRPKYAVANIG